LTSVNAVSKAGHPSVMRVSCSPYCALIGALILGRIGGARLRPIERDSGGQIGARQHCQLIDDTVAKAEANRAELATVSRS
jgi:hypothetical protein